MSIASDYATRCDAAKVEPKPFEVLGCNYNTIVGSITQSGQLWLGSGFPLSPAQALAFAEWIKEMFT